MMTNKKKKALLVGASGLVGNELLHILLDAPEYEHVTILTRKKINIEHPKLHQLAVDFDNLQNYKDQFQVNDVYCCLGTTIKKAGSQDAFRRVDFEYPLTLAKFSKENQIDRFLIITAIGSSSSSNIFYNRVKGEVEEAIKKVGLPSLHIFRPSLLLGDRQEFRLGEKFASLLSPLYSFLMVGSMAKYKPIQARNVAIAMYRQGQATENGEFTYSSDQIHEISAKTK